MWRFAKGGSIGNIYIGMDVVVQNQGRTCLRLMCSRCLARVRQACGCIVARTNDNPRSPYAQLGIREYFVFNLRRISLDGYRLSDSQETYTRLLPKVGRYQSEVLGLEISIETDLPRFRAGSTLLLSSTERIAMLEAKLAQLQGRIV